MAGLVESIRLVWKAKRLCGSPTIVMTDPPFLSTLASILLGRRNWALWSMDIYPDAYVANNLVSERNVFYRLLLRIVYRRAPTFLIALGPLQAKYLIERYRRTIPTVILPCGVFQAHAESNRPDWKTKNAGKIILGYCGNLGEAHSPEFLKAVIDHLDPRRFHLVLSVYGAKSKEVLDYLGDNRLGITVVDCVSRQQLGCIDIHLVSLLSRWAHVCVPSKAVSAVCSGSCFLFFAFILINDM